MEPKIDDKVISYHSFLLPFYSKSGELQAALSDQWDKDTLTDTHISSEKEERKLDYATAQYFTPEAQRLLFSSESSYRYQLKGKERFYEIEKDRVKYRLLVKKITVTVFDKNIGVLALHTEFHLKHQELDLLKMISDSEDRNKVILGAVKVINEHGRRINLPYLGTSGPNENGEYAYSHSLVADAISLFGEREDFAAMSKELYLGTGGYPMSGYIMKPISGLLRSLFPQNDPVPVIDDRMYVCCLVDNKELSDRIKRASAEFRESKPRDGAQGAAPVAQKELFTDPELSDEIYAIGFIDKDEASCGLEMRESILRRCVYNRWQQEGTIDVVTHHSFVRIVGAAPDYVIAPFVTQYVYMAIGALMQRAEILWLSNKSAEISRAYFKLSDTDKSTDNDGVNARLTELKRRYVYAQNNIFLDQLTVQEQGVEEFEMLKNELYVGQSLKKLDGSINGIYEFTREYAEIEENDLLSKIAKIGLPLALIQALSVITSFAVISEAETRPHWMTLLIQLGVLAVIGVISLLFLKWVMKKKKRGKGAARKNKKL